MTETIRYLMLESGAIHQGTIHQRAAIDYLDDVMALTAKVYSQHASPYLYPSDRSCYANHLTGRTINVFAFCGANLIGYTVLKLLQEWPTYLQSLDTPCDASALLLLTVLDPDFRGQGVGKEMSRQLIAAAQRHGITKVYSTTHPDNSAALKILESIGMHQIDQRLMFDEQLLRTVMFMDIISSD